MVLTRLLMAGLTNWILIWPATKLPGWNAWPR